MKNIKMILITAIAAMVLTGCGMNTIRENGNSYVEEISTSATIEEPVNSYEESNIVNEDSSSNAAKPENTSSVNVSSSTNEPVENPVESSTTTNNSTSSTIEEKPTSSSTNKPVSSSSNKPVEKPVSSSTSSSSTNKPTSSSTTKIEEKPIHTHSFTEATCTNPATCISCGETKGTTINHNYNNGSCIYCGKNDPNYVAPHNCKNDGHIWNNSYTESSTENVEIVETHTLSENGYDYDLAYRYFGHTDKDVHFTDYFGTNAFGSGSSKVKTTGVKTITRFIHECSECGYKEVYNTEETVTPDDNWVYAGTPRSKYFPVIWYDINNIPDVVYEEMEAYNEYLRANGWPVAEIPAH